MKDLEHFDFAESVRRSQERIAQRDEALEQHYKETSIDFKITTHELKACDEWKAAHDKVCPYYDDGTKDVSPTGAIGGRTSYRFTPTGLGVMVSIECACGATEDITDFGCW